MNYELPPEEIVTMTLLAGDAPCIICGYAIDQPISVVCVGCGAKTKYDLFEWRDYRRTEGKPQWFKQVNYHGWTKCDGCPQCKPNQKTESL